MFDLNKKYGISTEAVPVEMLIEASNKDLLGKKSPSVQDLLDKYQMAVDVFMPILMEGIKVEYEHTNCIYEASEIARDHLAEDIEYYTKLAKVEGKG